MDSLASSFAGIPTDGDGFAGISSGDMSQEQLDQLVHAALDIHADLTCDSPQSEQLDVLENLGLCAETISEHLGLDEHETSIDALHDLDLDQAQLASLVHQTCLTHALMINSGSSEDQSEVLERLRVVS